MSLFDVIRCDALLPDDGPSDGIHFQTKSFPDPSMQSYVITRVGRLLDMHAHDLEPEGCLTFDTNNEVSTHGRDRRYHARFADGQLMSIVREGSNDSDRGHYGLSSLRWYAAPPPFLGNPRNEWSCVSRGLELLLPEATPGMYSNHMRVDARNLTLHCLVARKILANPDLIEKARSLLARWKQDPQQETIPSYVLEWERILETSTDAIAGFLSSMSEDANRLRKRSPFRDLLTPEERSRIHASFR